MKNLEKYLTLLDGEVDGLLLTSRYSRHYGAEYDIAEGVAVVSKAGCRYFTDNRYTEAAENGIKGFQVLDVAKGGGYVKCINKCIEDFGITALGFEENYLTVAEHMYYEKELHAKLIPMNAKISGFRAVKEEWELDLMRKAQKITDTAFAEVQTKIKAGITEKQLQAELR
jgi:Xaa-Pro aminopeptidase